LAWTVTTFRGRFGEFTNAPTAVVQAAIDEAYRRTPSNVWGGIQDDGAGYLAAHLLALSPRARDMKLANEKGETIYGTERRRLARIVASGARVAGIPAELEALDIAAAESATPSGDPAVPPSSYVDAGFFHLTTPYNVPIAVAGTRYVVAPTLDVDGSTGWTYAAGVWTYGGAADIFCQTLVTLTAEPSTGGSTNISAGMYYDGVLEAHDQSVIRAAAKASGTVVIGSARTYSPGSTVEIRIANDGGTQSLDVWAVHWNILPASL
jgi:hypothetical protein